MVRIRTGLYKKLTMLSFDEQTKLLIKEYPFLEIRGRKPMVILDLTIALGLNKTDYWSNREHDVENMQDDNLQVFEIDSVKFLLAEKEKPDSWTSKIFSSGRVSLTPDEKITVDNLLRTWLESWFANIHRKKKRAVELKAARKSLNSTFYLFPF
jgi:hypothetical protein